MGNEAFLVSRSISLQQLSTCDTKESPRISELPTDAGFFDSSDVARHYTGLNKYVVIVLYSIMVIMSSSIYYNWPSVARLITRAGVYEWHCTDSDILGKDDGAPKCEAQRLKISHILVLTRSFDMLVSAITGFLADRCSQRIILLVGEVFSCIGWIVLSLGLKSDIAINIVFCCIGFCSSCIFMSSLSVVDLFPDTRGLAICFIIGAADDLSISVPLILNGIYTLLGPSNFHKVCLCYIILAIVPSILIANFVVPDKSWAACVKEYESMVMKSSNGSIHSLSVDDPIVFLELTDGTLTNFSDEPIPANNNQVDVESQLYNREVSLVKAEDLTKKPKLCVKFKEMYALLSNSFIYILSISFIFTAICFIVTNFSIVFMENVFIKYYETQEDVLFVSEILFSISIVPGIIFGVIIDKCGIVYVNYVLNTLAILAYSVICMKTRVAGYISGFLQMMLISTDYSAMIAYVNCIFPADQMATVIGSILFIDGIVSLALSHVDDIMLRSNGYYPIIIMTIALFVRFLLYIYLDYALKFRDRLLGVHVSGQVIKNCDKAEIADVMSTSTVSGPLETPD